MTCSKTYKTNIIHLLTDTKPYKGILWISTGGPGGIPGPDLRTRGVGEGLQEKKGRDCALVHSDQN